MKQKSSMRREERIDNLPAEAEVGLRKIESKDFPEVHELLMTYLKKFKLYLHFSLEEVEHFFQFREGVIHTYVKENEEHKITDFISFYSLPSTILKHQTHKQLNVRTFYFSNYYYIYLFI